MLKHLYEIVDWKYVKDAQYYKWIPVANEKEAEELSKLIPHELLRLPGIRIDFPTNADKPEGPYFISG